MRSGPAGTPSDPDLPPPAIVRVLPELAGLAENPVFYRLRARARSRARVRGRRARLLALLAPPLLLHAIPPDAGPEGWIARIVAALVVALALFLPAIRSHLIPRLFRGATNESGAFEASGLGATALADLDLAGVRPETVVAAVRGSLLTRRAFSLARALLLVAGAHLALAMWRPREIFSVELGHMAALIALARLILDPPDLQIQAARLLLAAGARPLASRGSGRDALLDAAGLWTACLLGLCVAFGAGLAVVAGAVAFAPWFGPRGQAILAWPVAWGVAGALARRLGAERGDALIASTRSATILLESARSRVHGDGEGPARDR